MKFSPKNLLGSLCDETGINHGDHTL